MNTSKKWSNFVMAKVNKLANIIREAKVIKFGDLCVKGHIAPSTLYSYKKIIEARFKDIVFDGEAFRVVTVENKGGQHGTRTKRG